MVRHRVRSRGGGGGGGWCALQRGWCALQRGACVQAHMPPPLLPCSMEPRGY